MYSYTLLMAGYEGAVSRSITLDGRVSAFEYDKDEDDDLQYSEEGSGTGIEFVFRYYTGKQALHGFYIGAAAGIASVSWDSTERACSSCTNQISGDGESSLFSIGFVMGGKIYFGKSIVYIEPNLNILQYIAMDTETSDSDDEVNVGIAPSAGLTLGVEF